MSSVYAHQYGNENLFKIGRSNNVERRRRHLVTGNPHGLTPFDEIEAGEYDSQVEKFIHDRLRNKRSRDSEAREFFRVTPDEVRKEMRLARHYLEACIPMQCKVERLASEPSNGKMLEPNDQELEYYSRLLDVRVEQDDATVRRQLVEYDLKLAIGTADGLKGLVTWKTETKNTFNLEAFKTEHPQMYTMFVRPVMSRIFRLQ
jgi:hypothetical protein